MRVLPYAQLLRIPNVFTAFADIFLGGLAAGTLLSRPLASLALLLASGCLYCAGMVWNDYFDFEIDKKERPFRPLPSGKISLQTALLLGSGLLVVGLLLALLAGWHTEGMTWRPLSLAALLVIAILLYDAWLKHTPVGPVGMGTCRLLNVLLGASLVSETPLPGEHRLHLASVVGAYIVGVTWLARNEAGKSYVSHLRGAVLVMTAAVLLALALPTRLPDGTSWVGFPYALTAFVFLIGIPLARVLSAPDSKNVQAAVKRCIMGLVVLDAVLATIYVGPWGLLIMLLLPPALLIGRRVYST